MLNEFEVVLHISPIINMIAENIFINIFHAFPITSFGCLLMSGNSEWRTFIY